MFFHFFLIFPISNLIFNQLYSQEKILVAPDVNVISVSPVQGSGLDIERVPGKVQILNRERLDKNRKNNFDSWYASGGPDALNKWQDAIINSSAIIDASIRMNQTFRKSFSLNDSLPLEILPALLPVQDKLLSICERTVSLMNQNN